MDKRIWTALKYGTNKTKNTQNASLCSAKYAAGALFFTSYFLKGDSVSKDGAVMNVDYCFGRCALKLLAGFKSCVVYMASVLLYVRVSTFVGLCERK